jgi:hypothetical protein
MGRVAKPVMTRLETLKRYEETPGPDGGVLGHPNGGWLFRDDALEAAAADQREAVELATRELRAEVERLRAETKNSFPPIGATIYVNTDVWEWSPQVVMATRSNRDGMWIETSDGFLCSLDWEGRSWRRTEKP